MEPEIVSIYKASRTIKRRENSLYNALRSIHEDSLFVGEIAQLWPDLPLIANLRCGLWYSPDFHGSCYFKSTDGHTNNWSFNTSRLNLHVALLAGQRRGCFIVDSTRKGKRFPDSMSKTIPIWTCVLNRAIRNRLNKMHENGPQLEGESNRPNCHAADIRHGPGDWDCSLHLPLWVSETEKAAIEDRLDEWTKQLEASGADIISLASSLQKPLRPLWVSQKTVIWLNEVPDHDSWDFTPIILVSASSPDCIVQHKTTSEFSWNYIPGAGDDEESWARGLSPQLFWNHAFDIINSGPDSCNKIVADIVEKDRVYRAQRDLNIPQISVKSSKLLGCVESLSDETESPFSKISNFKTKVMSGDEDPTISRLGSTNISVGATHHVTIASDIDCVLNCDNKSITVSLSDVSAYLHLPTVSSKFDRFSLKNNLPAAVNFARLNLTQGKKIMVCCNNGEDISICVSLAILISLYDNNGIFDDGKSYRKASITKWEMRRGLVYICQFAPNARPSRGNLKQVFSFLRDCGADYAL